MLQFDFLSGFFPFPSNVVIEMAHSIAKLATLTLHFPTGISSQKASTLSTSKYMMSERWQMMSWSPGWTCPSQRQYSRWVLKVSSALYASRWKEFVSFNRCEVNKGIVCKLSKVGGSEKRRHTSCQHVTCMSVISAIWSWGTQQGGGVTRSLGLFQIGIYYYCSHNEKDNLKGKNFGCHLYVE